VIFSSLLGNCQLMGHSEPKKNPVTGAFHWGSGNFLSCPKAGSINVPPSLSCSLGQSIFSWWPLWEETVFRFSFCSSRPGGRARWWLSRWQPLWQAGGWQSSPCGVALRHWGAEGTAEGEVLQ